MIASSLHRQLAALALGGVALFGLRPALAQPVIDQALSDAQLSIQKGCANLQINFNIRIRYASHFPLDRGAELRITLNPIDRRQAAALLALRRQGLAVANGKIAAIKAIELETQDPTGPALRITFDHPVAYQVAPHPNAQSIVVAIAGTKPSTTCKPVFLPVAGTAFPIGVIRDPSGGAAGAAAGSRIRPTGTISESDLRAIAAWMDEGRAALKHNELGGAIALFTKVLKYPENQYSAEAQELLGLARQKNGQPREAIAEYEDYLRRYPSGEPSERVRQRLAGVITASGNPTGPLHTPNGQPVGGPPIGKFAPTHETTWTVLGSVSEFYVRDDSFRTVRDPTLAPDPTADPDAHRVHQNQLLSSLDSIATWNDDQTKGKIRFSGNQEHGFDSNRDLVGVAALSVDTLVKDWNLRTVVGRQTLNTDGVLGRFDGTLASWQALPMVRFDLVGGSPALSRFDFPFKDDKYFYAAGVGLGPFFGGFETTIYGMEQRDRKLVDREAVGSEFRYFDADKFAFATVDYDVLFQRLNAAIFSGSWTLPDKSTIYGGADYRRTPFLSTWNALLNQPFATLYDMVRFQTSEQLQQLAINQTPIYKSAMLGASHPLSEQFQVSADATIVSLTQPITSIGLDPSLASLPAGNEYYYSAQLIGSNLIKDGDMYTAALRYSQLLTTNMYVLDLNTRYPLTNEWRISPRLRLGYSLGRGIDLKEYTVLPSVLVDYYWNKGLSFEAEVGAQWTSTMQSGIKSNDTELLATVGLRYDFYPDVNARAAEVRAKCATPAAAALCRYGMRPDGGTCALPPPGCR